MKCNVVTCLITLNLVDLIASDNLARARRKRYVAFPEGSTFGATLCATVATITEFSIYYEGINWGTSWTLPNRSTVEEYVLMNKHHRRRKQRRDVYGQVEGVLDSMGHDGRSCIYRALCEAPRKFTSKPETLSEDLLYRFFFFPLQLLSKDEPEDHRLYHSAYRKGKEDVEDCALSYPDCEISLIDLALGFYSN